MMVLGSAAAIAALAILGGVAVGRRISVPAQAAGSGLAPPVAAEAPVPSPRLVAAVPPAAPVATYAAPEQPAAIAVDGVTPVENLPKATVQPEAKVAPAYARPAVRPVAGPPPAAPKTESHAQAKVAIEAAGRDDSKDPVSPDEGASAPQASQATQPTEPAVDPLVKAVRDDIQEEEAARKK
jgi:hypothetical protein